MSNAARPRRAYKRALIAAVATAAVAVPVVSSQAAAAAPVYYSTPSSHHVVVQSAWPNSLNYDRRQNPDRMITGYIAAIPQVQPEYVSRSFFQLNTAPLAGKQILRATVEAKVINSYSCSSASPTQLWQTGVITRSTTWNAQPGFIRELGSTIKNNQQGCANDGYTFFDVTSLITDAARNGWQDVTLGLKAANERDPAALRHFAFDPVLTIEYNSVPNTPAELSTDNSGCGAHAYVPTTTPQLRARVSDPDGDQVETIFHLFDSSNQLLWQGSTYAQSGTFAQVQAQNIPAEGKYRWIASSRDGIAASAWTSPCEFTVGAPDPSETTSTPPPPPAG